MKTWHLGFEILTIDLLGDYQGKVLGAWQKKLFNGGNIWEMSFK